MSPLLRPSDRRARSIRLREGGCEETKARERTKRKNKTTVKTNTKTHSGQNKDKTDHRIKKCLVIITIIITVNITVTKLPIATCNGAAGCMPPGLHKKRRRGAAHACRQTSQRAIIQPPNEETLSEKAAQERTRKNITTTVDTKQISSGTAAAVSRTATRSGRSLLPTRAELSCSFSAEAVWLNSQQRQQRPHCTLLENLADHLRHWPSSPEHFVFFFAQ